MPSPVRACSTDGRTSRLSRFFRLFAEWHAVFCSSHAWTPPVSAPELAAVAQAFFCTSHDRPRAALTPTNVSPFTENGRSPVLWMTAGAVPPRDPVKTWTFVPEAEPVLLPGKGLVRTRRQPSEDRVQTYRRQRWQEPCCCSRLAPPRPRLGKRR